MSSRINSKSIVCFTTFVILLLFILCARYQPSAISPYDMLRIDPSGGVIDARIHKPLDDEGFDKIWQIEITRNN